MNIYSCYNNNLKNMCSEQYHFRLQLLDVCINRCNVRMAKCDQDAKSCKADYAVEKRNDVVFANKGTR